MQTVRDEEGLTYSIGANHSADAIADGFWKVSATFNPTLLEQGYNSTMKQIRKWVEEGITQEELDAKKSNLAGSFKVGLSSSKGMSFSILNLLNSRQVAGIHLSISRKITSRHPRTGKHRHQKNISILIN